MYFVEGLELHGILVDKDYPVMIVVPMEKSMGPDNDGVERNLLEFALFEFGNLKYGPPSLWWHGQATVQWHTLTVRSV
jgi:hypothetical protein